MGLDTRRTASSSVTAPRDAHEGARPVPPVPPPPQRSRRGPRWGALWAAVALMGLVWWLSSRPASALPVALPVGTDKLVHATVFGTQCALWGTALAPLGAPTSTWGAAVGIVVVYGIVDEWHQRGVPGRHADPLDAVADGAGALVVAAVAMRRRRVTGRVRRVRR